MCVLKAQTPHFGNQQTLQCQEQLVVFAIGVLSMWPCKSVCFLHPNLVVHLFATPPIKLKLGQQIGGGLLIANHLDQSLWAVHYLHILWINWPNLLLFCFLVTNFHLDNWFGCFQFTDCGECRIQLVCTFCKIKMCSCFSHSQEKLTFFFLVCWTSMKVWERIYCTSGYSLALLCQIFIYF
jgi:hypothetical protein